MAAPAALLLLLAQQAMAQQNPGQPTKSGRGGTFEVVGESGVSAQMLFLGTTNKVYIVDKTENNPAQVAGHPAWATEYDLTTNLYRTMDIRTNAFCAGGATLGDGTWLNVGGNEAILAGGDPVTDGSGGPYNTVDGRRAVRTLTPCDDESCQWVDDPANYMSGERWYPTLEPLEDGRVIIIGGHARGGFVNDAVNNVPTYEFFPRNGEPTVELDLLKDTLPANLFPLTWLLPSGRLFVQLNYGTYILDYKNAAQRETRLADMPHAVRTYPASAASLLLPLTPANNYRATFMFCGGTDLQPTEWNPDTNLAQHPADNSCVKITPEDPNPAFEDDPDEYLPVGRVMGSAIILPTGQIVVLNGANKGVAGYGKQAWVIGQSYADEPLLRPLIYSPDKPPAERWSDADFQDSTVERMYHSSATLLPDGSIFVSGSNPNADVVPAGGPRFVTEYAVERFYPMYYDKRRPEPRNLPNSLSYGGAYFNVSLSNEDLEGSLNNLNSVKAVIIRAGFSTHAMNMGQRMLQLETTYTGNADGSATLHVSQLPPNPALFAPGPALMFVVVNDVPSVGVQVMIGNGRIGAQTTTDNAALPTSFIPEGAAGGSGGGSNGGGNGGGNNNGAISFGVSSSLAVAAVLGLFALLA